MSVLDPQILNDNVDNLIQLNELTENTILHNLRIRFQADKIYTFVSSILVAVNPLKMLEVYTPELLDSYKDEGTAGKAPHCWSIADNAFRNYLRDHTSQSVIVSGESGSERQSTKLILQYLAEVSGSDSGRQGVSAEGADDVSVDDEDIQPKALSSAFCKPILSWKRSGTRKLSATTILHDSAN